MGQQAAELPRRDVARPEPMEMSAGYLAVDGQPGMASSYLYEMGQGHLGGVAHAAEHRFAKKHRSESHAVKATRQFIFQPALYGMGVPQAVEAAVGVDHRLVDPGSFPSFQPDAGALTDHPLKGEIASDAEPAAAQGAPQAAGTVEFVGKEDTAGIWSPPEDRLAGRVPGKDSLPVGEEQAFGREIAPYGQQAIGAGQFWWRKDKAVGELEDGHSGLQMAETIIALGGVVGQAKCAPPITAGRGGEEPRCGWRLSPRLAGHWR